MVLHRELKPLREGGWIGARRSLWLLGALLSLLCLATPAVAKYAAMVVDADTGRVYFSRNADERNHPASLTKMMTLYMVFEALEAKRLTLNQKMVVSEAATQRPPSRLRLRKGQTLTVEEGILALVTKSANDVATVIAEALAKDEDAFARLMTRRAQQLGMSRTTFGNASGLPHPRQRSTARDMVTLAMALKRDFPQYYSYFGKEEFTWKGRTYRNHNNLLGRFEGTTGIKTGYTNAAGFNLVAMVERPEHRLVGVVFGGRTAGSRDAHMRTILGKTFTLLERAPQIITPERVPIPAFRPGTGDRDRVARQAALDSGAPVPEARPLLADDGTPLPMLRPGEQLAQGDADPDGDDTNWAVQIGAYSDYRRARQVARQAVSDIPGLAIEGLAIEPLVRDGSPIYRARIIGLSELAARRACARLERNDLPCVPVAPDGDV